MAVAARTGHLRRNFQGYTDDTCDVLIGLGASAISKFPQGYAQNASATAQYQASVRDGQMATGRGHAFKGEDKWRGRMIEMLLCTFAIDAAEIRREFDVDAKTLSKLFRTAVDAYPGMTQATDDRFEILEKGRPLARMIARVFDGYEMRAEGHSAAF
jgi:oxygen-independent coproporphyrinogen-3 oxidase